MQFILFHRLVAVATGIVAISGVGLNAAQGAGWIVAADIVGGSGSARATAGGLRRLQNQMEVVGYNPFEVVSPPDSSSQQTMPLPIETPESIVDGTEESDMPSEQTDVPPEDTEPVQMWLPTYEYYEPTQEPYAYSPSPAQAADAPGPGEDLEQGDEGAPPLPEATDASRPVWYGSVEDGGYQIALGKGYDSWQAQVNTQFEFKTAPQLYTLDPVFDFSLPGGGCGPQPGLQGLAAPCGVRVTPIELYNASILEWRTDCRDLQRLTLRSSVSPASSLLALTIFGNADAEYKEFSESNPITVDVVAEATFTMYTAAISSATPPPFTAAFLKMASELPPKFNDEHKAFVRTYGTYFVEKVTMGGLEANYYRLDEHTSQMIHTTSMSAEEGIRFAMLKVVGARTDASLQEEVYSSLRASVVNSFRYGIESHAPVSGMGQTAANDPAKVDPKPIKLTLKPIEGLFLSEFGLPEDVQSQWANIKEAAQRKREEAPEPVTISPAEYSDMDLGWCSLSSPPRQHNVSFLFYLIGCLLLLFTAIGCYCCGLRSCLGRGCTKTDSQFVTTHPI